ncbi:NADH dehydrogenase [ubiquinone] 1 alpha subcomplex subunit 7 isoform X2 [Hydra vulgaris]|uniref:NADH dehydrogenase [ubiquinone] 1 alpha subcomplex subunit 7 n=1 Tax=Hydra vulgaris TaxID=6087 RepID=A0ABM4C6N2_HYDVU
MATSKGALQRIVNFLTGKEYNMQLRYAVDQVKRTQNLPNLPPGVAHKLSKNYYGLTRDYRRDVAPPKSVTKSSMQLKAGETQLVRLKLVSPGEVFPPM